ncbi:hypothetical protein Rsub_11096 [Raphidocelis subcapitata]|uniref:Cytochrome b561 domain-containing protein n=1 Tax=Raphidocelis subcapitata TaxID=307507 RepID=A0A2V0PF21_9CHLO|nr:hypothetical protein Rsub_11096 [Raphidocelis subcapitata]|eukprot:GBF98451.1 hypothetical protein Rsub_11096 [Raphidocelis subcapitata]
MRPAALVLLGLACLYCVADAYPVLWAELPSDERGATAAASDAHPSKQEAEHAAPVADSATKFTVTSKAGAPAAKLCPGVTYTVQVDFPESRLAFLTTSVGTFVPEDPACPNRHVELKPNRGPSLAVDMKVPCAPKGVAAGLHVTSAKGSSGGFHSARATLPVDPACAAAACSGAGAAAAAAPKAVPKSAAAAVAPAEPAEAPAAAAAAAKPAAAKAPAAAGAKAVKAAAVPGCTPSELGYSCVATTRRGTRVHYSLGGAPPDNACTRGAAGGAAAAKAGQQLMHFAYEGMEPGYAALGFTARPGKMYPSDAVIGWVAPDGTAKVSGYHLTSYEVAPTDAAPGWASNLGVVSEAGATTVCFSRALSEAAAKAVPKLNEDGAPMIWASSPDHALVEHSRWGSYVADLRPLLAAASGDAAALAALAGARPTLVVPDDDAAQAAASRARVAHGVLMLAAFGLLMPLGALLARHKWLYGDHAAEKIHPGWFHLHIRIQVLAILAAVAGTILVFAFFGDDRKGVNKLYTPHMALGLAAVVAAVLQAGIGHKRPGITHESRDNWRALHYSWGFATMLSGIANCGIGIALVHGIQGDKLEYWVAPTATVLGLLGLAALVLENKRQQVIRNRVYNPSSHAFTPKPSYASGLADAGAPASRSAATSRHQLLPDAQKSNGHHSNGAAARYEANGAAV